MAGGDGGLIEQLCSKAQPASLGDVWSTDDATAVRYNFHRGNYDSKCHGSRSNDRQPLELLCNDPTGKLPPWPKATHVQTFQLHQADRHPPHLVQVPGSFRGRQMSQINFQRMLR